MTEVSTRLRRHGPALCIAACILSLLVPWREVGLNATLAADASITVALGWGLWRAVRQGNTRVLGSWPVLLAVAGLVCTALSAMGSPDPLRALQGLARIIEVFLIFPMAFLLALRRRTDVLLVLGALSVLVATQALLGVWQTATRTGAIIDEMPIRGVGTFGADNIGVLATLTASGMAMALAFAMSYTGRLRAVALVLGAVFVAGSVAALSRASWLAAGAMALVLLTRFTLRRALVVVVLAAVGLATAGQLATAAGGAIGQRFASLLTAGSNPDQSVIDRYSLWEAAGRMIDDRPWLGVGPLQFQAHRDSYAPLALLGSSDIGQEGTFERQALLSPHNLYLLLASEMGVPAATCFALLLIGSFVIGALRLRRTPREEQLSWAVGLTACGMLVCVTIDSLFGDLGGPTSIYVGWCLGLGCWWAAHRPDDAEP